MSVITLPQSGLRVKRPGKHIAIDADGNPCLRTRLMPRQRAEAFARALQARDYILKAEVILQPRASEPRCYYVEFITAGTADRAHAWLQQQRSDRAAKEGAGYQYWVDPDEPRRTWVLSVSGNVWEMWRGDCDCPDHACRGRKAGLRCKHMIELERRLSAGIPLVSERGAA